jgi:hypothetical protein
MTLSSWVSSDRHGVQLQVRLVLRVLFGIAVLLSVAFVLHAGMTGISVPYPDPTVEQAAYERSQGSVSTRLFSAAGTAWLTFVIAAVSHLIMRRRAVRTDQDF